MPFGSGSHHVAKNGSSWHHFYWLLAYCAFVIYGSLVPLEFHAHPLDWAWARFQQMPMLHLGIESRADWIANGILYIPLGFLAANFLTEKQSGDGRLSRLALSVIFCCCLALAIEFAQIFFPPRTVSLNDIVAESLGSIVGIVLAAYGTAWFRSLLSANWIDHTRFLNLILQLYLFAFVALALFPYDFVLSVHELAIKAASDNWSWWQAETAEHRGVMWSLLRPAIEVATTLPVGILVARRSTAKPGGSVAALRFGFILGLLIETAQFFTYSGLSQGLSLITRAFGCWLGAVLWGRRANYDEERVAAIIRRLTLPLTPVYLIAVLALNGWFNRQWQGLDGAIAAFSEVHFLPFYYHYFTTEAHALSSLISVAALYAPIGIAVWAFGRSPRLAAFLAFLLGLGVETSRLFLVGAHPDPTNILIAGAAAWFATALVTQLTRSLRAEQGEEYVAPAETSQAPLAAAARESLPVSVSRVVRRPSAMGLFGILVAVSAIVLWLSGFPLQPVLLAFVLTAFAAVIWIRPLLLVVLVPACLPVFDLAPWSGHFYIDEFDALLLLGLTIAYGRTPPVKAGSRDGLLKACLGLLALSVVISALIPLVPWPGADINAMVSYFSPFNGLRIGKGLLWGVLFCGVMYRLARHGQPVALFFARGMVLGLVATLAIVLSERSIFGGLGSLASDYRITGPFSSMHNGGAYIECFFTLAVPFVIFLQDASKARGAKLFGAGLLLLTTYALMLTYSRNGYLAFAVATFLGFATTALGAQGRHKLYRGGAILLLACAMAAVAIPVFSGKVAQERMAHLGTDFDTRLAHWQDALSIRDDGWATALFGMGLGRYPETHYWRSSEPERTAQYRLEQEGDNTFLRISAGQPIYVEQLVGVGAEQAYRLSFDIRTAVPAPGAVVVTLCEKWMLASSTCAGRVEAPLAGPSGSWQHVEQPIDAGGLVGRPWFARGPVKLTVFNSSKVSADIDNVRLETPYRQDLIENGDFSHGMDAWFSASDSHLPWHTKSLPVGLLFDQGWLGLLAFAAFGGLCLVRAAARIRQGDLAAGAAFAALTGFLIVGLFDTLIDAPRFLFLFVVLGMLGSLPPRSQRRADEAPT